MVRETTKVFKCDEQAEIFADFQHDLGHKFGQYLRFDLKHDFVSTNFGTKIWTNIRTNNLGQILVFGQNLGQIFG